MVLVVAAARRLSDLATIAARTWALLACASVLIAANWVIYIYAVNNGHVVDAALGYFINPLVTVALGLVVFRERLNRTQVAALLIAVSAVVVLTVEVGAPPVIGLGLALSRGLTEAMGGTLEPEETPGGGLTMVVTLKTLPETGPVFNERGDLT